VERNDEFQICFPVADHHSHHNYRESQLRRCSNSFTDRKKTWVVWYMIYHVFKALMDVSFSWSVNLHTSHVV